MTRLASAPSNMRSSWVARWDGVQKTWPAVVLGETIFDRFADVIVTGCALPENIVSIEMAAEDIRLLHKLEQTA